MRKLICCTIVSGGLLSSGARADIIYSDTFTDTAGTAWSSHQPDIHTPTASSTPYTYDNGYGAVATITGPTGAGDAVKLDIDAGVLPLASGNGYTKPTTFAVSLDCRLGTMTLQVGGNGIGVGFWSSNSFTDPNNEFQTTGNGGAPGFTGLVLNPDYGPSPAAAPAGAVRLFVNGVEAADIPYDPALFGNAAFNPNAFYRLSYSVDTTTGGISNAKLTGPDGIQNQTYTFSTTAFTDAATAYVGLYGSDYTSLGIGYADNLLVTDGAVPEPGALGALSLMGSLVALRRYRRNGEFTNGEGD
jgi:hypothetical protein